MLIYSLLLFSATVLLALGVIAMNHIVNARIQKELEKLRTLRDETQNNLDEVELLLLQLKSAQLITLKNEKIAKP